MKIYKTQKEVEKDIEDGVLAIEGDVKFECSISIEAEIIVTNGDINAGDINAGDINAWDINAGDINARNINARDINAGDINAWDINARNINARDINYYAFCDVYQSIKCTSIKARREKHQEPICLDGSLEIKKEATIEKGKKVKIKVASGQIIEGEIVK